MKRAFKYIFGAGFPPQKYLCPDKCEAAQRLCAQAGRLGRALAVPTSASAEILSEKSLGQYRIIIFVRLRSQIFRQIVQKRRRRADARQVDFVRYD